MLKLVIKYQNLIISKTDINETIIILHEAYCHRNITLCEICNEPINKIEYEEHLQIHQKVQVSCQFCGLTFHQEEINRHQSSKCTSRFKKCQFCFIELSNDLIESHQILCGARTDKCNICSKYIKKQGKYIGGFLILTIDIDSHVALCIYQQEKNSNLPSILKENEKIEKKMTQQNFEKQDLIQPEIAKNEENLNNLQKIQTMVGKRNPGTLLQKKNRQKKSQNDKPAKQIVNEQKVINYQPQIIEDDYDDDFVKAIQMSLQEQNHKIKKL